MATFLRVAMARVRGFLRPGDGQHDHDEEIEAHLAMATEDKIRQGLSPREARRRARIRLGNLTQLREAGSASSPTPPPLPARYRALLGPARRSLRVDPVQELREG